MKVIILRGLPGAGKSSLHLDATTTTVSADHHFTDSDGVYKFVPSELGDAHKECLQDFLKLLQSYDANVVVVDNTNLTAMEIAPYYRLAEVFDYEVEIVTVQCDPAVAFIRNIHGVPEATHKRMAETLANEKLPPWWNHRVINTSEGTL